MTKTTTQSPSGSARSRNHQNDKQSDKGGRRGKNGRNDRNQNTSAKPKKNGFQGQLQSGVLRGYVITENTTQRPIQYRNLKKKLPAFCAEKDYDGLDEIVRDMTDWDENKFFTKRPDASKWSEMMNVRVADDEHGKPIMRKMNVVVDTEMKEELLGAWKAKKKFEDAKWNKCQEDKKKLITLIRGQLDEGTSNELELSEGYGTAIADGNVVKILKNLRAICFGDDDDGLSYKPSKAAVAVKSLCNFKSPKTNDPHYFKDELRTKFQATLALSNRFPCGTIYMEEELALNKELDSATGKMVSKPLTIENYFNMTEEKRAFWEKKGDERAISMIYINNCQCEDMKRDLRMAYSHGSRNCYRLDVESLARLQSTQYRKQDTRATPSGTAPGTHQRRNGGTGDGKENIDPTDNGHEQPMVAAHPDTPDKSNNNGGKNDKKDYENDNDDALSLGGAHVKVIKKSNDRKSLPKPRSAEEILGSHPYNDRVWNAHDDASVDSCGSEEGMAGIYVGYAEESSDEEDSSETDLEHEDFHLRKDDGGGNDFLPDDPDINNKSHAKMSKDELLAHQDLFGGKHPHEPYHGKYYAVAKGRIPGIYRNWETCSKQVDGYSGAVHKRFSTEGAAAAFIKRYQKIDDDRKMTAPPTGKPNSPSDNIPNYNVTTTKSDIFAKDCNGTRLHIQDSVMILNDGGCKVRGKIGKIVHFGEGVNGKCNIVIDVKNMPKQIRIGKHVLLVSHASINEMSTKMADFRLGQHEN